MTNESDMNLYWNKRFPKPEFVVASETLHWGLLPILIEGYLPYTHKPNNKPIDNNTSITSCLANPAVKFKSSSTNIPISVNLLKNKLYFK